MEMEKDPRLILAVTIRLPWNTLSLRLHSDPLKTKRKGASIPLWRSLSLLSLNMSIRTFPTVSSCRYGFPWWSNLNLRTRNSIIMWTIFKDLDSTRALTIIELENLIGRMRWSSMIVRFVVRLWWYLVHALGTLTKQITAGRDVVLLPQLSRHMEKVCTNLTRGTVYEYLRYS